MHWRLSLIMALFLAAADAPPLPCGPGTTSTVLPSHVLNGSAPGTSGHPSSGHIFSNGLSPGFMEKPVIANPTREVACGPPNPAARSEDALRDVSGDALHGLPAPDLMHVMPNPLGH